MITAIYVLGIILLIGSVVGLFYLVKNERLNAIIYKLDMCDRDLDDNLKKKEDEILRLINIINRELGLFEVHLACWEDIVDLLKENRQTFQWYINDCQYKDNTDVEIKIML